MPGRNDPCPCGSGKKYKQCCLSKQSEEQIKQAQARRFFDRKCVLTKDLIAFLSEKQGGERSFALQKNSPFDTVDDRLREGAGTMWAFFFRKYGNGMRGIDWFLEERGGRYAGADREMLERWRTANVSCFQAVDRYERGMVVEDIWSGGRYRMPYCETMWKLPPWAVSVCMIEPYVEDWCILGVALWTHPDLKLELIDWVRERQKVAAHASDRRLLPADLIAAGFPEVMSMCSRMEQSQVDDGIDRKETKEQALATYEYICDDPGLLEERLLDIGGYVRVAAAGRDDSEVVISRADPLDAEFAAIPAERRERLGLDEVRLSTDLGRIVMDGRKVTVSGWWSDELEATVRLLEEDLASVAGLHRIHGSRESLQVPKHLALTDFNVITDRTLSEQEVGAYISLPQWLKWFRKQQATSPGESAETLVRKAEYEQHRRNPDMANLNLLRIALGLPPGPFAEG